jgi:hypothetical protein
MMEFAEVLQLLSATSKWLDQHLVQVYNREGNLSENISVLSTVLQKFDRRLEKWLLEQLIDFRL